MGTASVVNVKTDACEVYIGRRQTGMHYGNPFGIEGIKSQLAVKTFKTRAEAIAAYQDWLAGVQYGEVEPERRRWILANLPRLAGKRLGCYCKPLACHGDVLVALLERPST